MDELCGVKILKHGNNFDDHLIDHAYRSLGQEIIALLKQNPGQIYAFKTESSVAKEPDPCHPEQLREVMRITIRWSTVVINEIDPKDKIIADQKRELLGLITIMQKHQRRGSPPPGGPELLLQWILETLEKNEKSLVGALQAIKENLRVYLKDDNTGLIEAVEKFANDAIAEAQ